MTRTARTISLLLPWVLLAAPGAAQAPGEEFPDPYGLEQTWTSRDKIYHFGVSAVAAAAVYGGARWVGVKRWPAMGIAVGLTGAAGIVREIQDRRRPEKYFSEKDLLWNAGGIVVGVWIPDRLLSRRLKDEPARATGAARP